MIKVTFKIEGGEDVTIFAAYGNNVLELARKASVHIDAPCSGNGTCGKCRVKLLEGDISDSEIKEGWLLACEAFISGEAVFFVPDAAFAYVKNITYELFSAQEQKPQSNGSSSYEFNESTGGRPTGLAIDIGTTSVSALLVDMDSKYKLAKASTGNAQIRYGADVINRIIEQQKHGGIEKMQTAIINDTLLPLIDKLCIVTGTDKKNIIRIVIAANTTMNHLLLGVDANSIRIEPYEPAFLEFDHYNPANLGIPVAPDAKLILTPNIGSYVGGDITAGVIVAVSSSGETITDRPKMSLLIDLGTNGEIVFGNNEFLMACACSAGPAFEGGDISCGMRATEGAIEACTLTKQGDRRQGDRSPCLSVIGGGKPAGLCGSGLIDVVAELYQNGIINSRGKFTVTDERVRYDEYGTGSYILAFANESATGKEIILTETDIDNFIRAKAAIFSGIISLLSPLGFTPEDIDDVMIAGGIGSGINIKNAISIGMLPKLPENKYNYIGNSSLNGAYDVLISPAAEKNVHDIARNMTYIDLSSQPGYMDDFIAACFLPHTDETLFM